MDLLESLQAHLSSFGFSKIYWIGYSGGLDSHVLLHAMVQLRQKIPQLNLKAVHVNHGLSTHAETWVNHCREICNQLQVEFFASNISHTPAIGMSIEAWAREQRYRIFTELLTPDGILLTAHHKDDQAETVLLQLFRGAGPKGLSAMPFSQNLSAGHLVRPLLNWTRDDLQVYARQANLSWIEDDSNHSQKFDRNFLRHAIFPLLKNRWPSVTNNIARSAHHCAEASENLTALAELDLTKEFSEMLAVNPLKILAPARQRNVLRHWLKSLACLLPSTQVLHQIQKDLINGRADSQAQVSWGNWTIRKNKQNLVVEQTSADRIIQQKIPWDLMHPLELPNGWGRLSAHQQIDGSLSIATLNLKKLTIQFRSGGERCRLAGKKHSSSLKKLFQKWEVPHWKRNQVPLLYYEDQLAMVVGYCVCEPFASKKNELGWSVLIE